MAKKKEAAVEEALRRVVRELNAAGEAATMGIVRSKVEAQLGLESGYLKQDAWKAKSRKIMEDAMDGSDDEEESVAEEPAKTAATATKDISKETTSPTTKPTASTPKVNGKKETMRSESESSGDNESDSESTSSGEDDSNSEASSSSSAEESDKKDTKKSKAAPKKPDHVPSKINGVKRKAEEPDSFEDDSDESGQEQKKQKTKATSSSSSAEDTTSSSAEDDTASKPQKEKPKTKPSKATKPTASSLPILKAIPPQPFHPPPGFNPMKPSLLAQPNPLSTTNLSGKQIWHITAPSDIPFTSITNLTLEAITSSTPILTHNTTEYALVEDPHAGKDSTTIFIPTEEGYRPLQQPVERSLHLQQKITLPNLTTRQASQLTGSRAAGDVAQAAVSNVRPQPRGLKMRYRPPGFGEGDAGAVGSGSESADEGGQGKRPTFQFPRSLGGHGTDERDGDVTMVDAEAPASARKEKKMKEKGESSIKPNCVVAPLSEPTTETKEEKAKRKEEKRLRKEAKRKAQEAAAS